MSDVKWLENNTADVASSKHHHTSQYMNKNCTTKITTDW